MNNEIRTLESHGVRVTETMTTPSKPGKKPRPVWVAAGNTFGLETFFREIGGKKFRGAWSFFKDPSADILGELNSNARQSFAEQIESTIERKEARIERFEGYSENAEARATASSEKAFSILSVIPPGQPILVGHHSERRHRRDISRSDNAMRKSVEEFKKSEYYDYKATSLGNQVSRARESLKYMENRFKEAKKELNTLKRWAEESLGKRNQEDLHQRIAQAQEKFDYWKKRIEERENELLADGKLLASPKTIRVGDEIYYASWLPVIRVNRNTVTVSHWLGVPTLTYKIEYRRIEKFRRPGAV